MRSNIVKIHWLIV